MLKYTFQPLAGTFPRPLTEAANRKESPFDKPWKATLMLLEKELKMLRFREGSVVLSTAHTKYDTRASDGMLREDARKPEHPGVVVRFDAGEKLADGTQHYAPMSFECDQFTEWRANVRAIADAMEALRKVDRYGVSGGGRANAHYQGYKALPSAEGKLTTLDAAVKFLAEHSGVPENELLVSGTARYMAFKRANVKLHPDAPTGNTDLFVQLQDARRFLEQL